MFSKLIGTLHVLLSIVTVIEEILLASVASFTYLADVIVALTVLCVLLSLIIVHYKILFFGTKKDD